MIVVIPVSSASRAISASPSPMRRALAAPPGWQPVHEDREEDDIVYPEDDLHRRQCEQARPNLGIG